MKAYRVSIVRGVLGAVGFAFAAPTIALAGGLILPGGSAVSTGRAGAAVASIDDPSAISINPARLVAVEGKTAIHVGALLLDYRMKFQRAGTYDDVPGRTDPWEGTPYPVVEDQSSPPVGLGGFQVVPVISVATKLGGTLKGVTVGAGIFAPNAFPVRSLSADYVFEDPAQPPPPSRYDMIEQDAAIVLPSIAAAYQVDDKLSLGARFSSGFSHVKARTYVWGLNNFEEWVGRDAEFSVDVKDNFMPSFGLGAHYVISDALEVGAAWHSGMTIDGKGTGTSELGSGNELTEGSPIVVIPAPDPLCASGGTADVLKACLKVKLPWIANVGGRYVVRDDAGNQVADVELNFGYEAWSSASDYEVIVDGFAAVSVDPPNGLPLQLTMIRHNLQDTMALRLGGSWQTPTSFGQLMVRGGISHDTAAAKEGWERVDLDGAARTTGTFGLSLRRPTVQIDLGGGIVYEGSRTQGTGCNPAGFNQGCTPGSTPAPNDDRPGPDPSQPTADPSGQQQSPFNEGTYESGYTLLMLGVTTWF